MREQSILIRGVKLLHRPNKMVVDLNGNTIKGREYSRAALLMFGGG